jgi:aminoglycoside phosphotransferase (APT) family kinase protein
MYSFGLKERKSMSKPWLAEIAVDTTLAQQLIEEQCPQLKPFVIEYLGEGWDNIVYRVNHEYVFRFPRRQEGANLIEVEWKLLPTLSKQLSLPIPTPFVYGTPTTTFKWPFLGYQFLEGKSADLVHLSREERTQLAAPLAHFLKVLHAIDVNEALELGVEIDLVKMDLESLIPIALNNIKKIEELNLFHACNVLRKLVESVKNIKVDGTKKLLHGDMYCRHMLINRDRQLCGVIDWGDARIGHPAIDLNIVFSFLPKEAHDRFFDIYGSINNNTKILTQFRALYGRARIILYAADMNDHNLLQEELQGLSFLLETLI